MRKVAILLIPVLAALAIHAPAQSKKKSGYELEFDNARDVLQMDKSPDGKDGIYIKVRFSINLDGDKVDKVDDDFKILIEENGKHVKTVDVPRLIASADLSVILALDTSGSMKQHGRMEQARAAADVFLKKLPSKSDCGLILFDHEIREKLTPIYERPPLLTRINLTQPRGGTAYLDAGYEAVQMLTNAGRGRGRAVVLMTDGIDLNSKKSILQLIDTAKKERAKVYTVGIGEPGKLEQVNTVLVLDHSGSMAPPADDVDTTPKIQALHLAGQRYVDSMSSAGRIAVIPFSTFVDTPRPFRDKSQVTALKTSITKLEPKGETALFDATYDAINLLDADSSRGRRAVVAMTDGVDNSSRRRVEEVIERAKDSSIPLYLLGFGRQNELDDATMKRMAESTGGKYFHAKNKDALIEIFEQLSIQLHDDGIDEASLKRIAKETGGQYFPAKNVKELKLILEQVTDSIQQSYEIVFQSLNQRADGTQRNVTLKLVQRGAGGTDRILDEKTSSYQTRGLIVAEMSPIVYLVLLTIIGMLVAIPSLLRRSPSV